MAIDDHCGNSPQNSEVPTQRVGEPFDACDRTDYQSGENSSIDVLSLYKEAKPGTVKVESSLADGLVKDSGTGFLVSENGSDLEIVGDQESTIITNNHVVKPKQEAAMIDAYIQKADLDGSGGVTKNELFSKELPEGIQQNSLEYAQRHFDEINKDGNNEINWDEARDFILDNSQVTITTSDGKTHQAKIKAADAQRDLSALAVNTGENRYPGLALSDTDAKEQDSVLALGHPRGSKELFASPGKVTGPHEQIAHKTNVEANAEHGNSGGPVLNESGEVVGVLSSVTRDNPDREIQMVDVKHVKNLLNKEL